MSASVHVAKYEDANEIRSYRGVVRPAGPTVAITVDFTYGDQDAAQKALRRVFAAAMTDIGRVTGGAS